MSAQADRIKEAEEALRKAEEALKGLDGPLSIKTDAISVSDATVHGRKVRVVSIISEKSAR